MRLVLYKDVNEMFLEFLQLFVGDEKYDIPRAHAHPGGYEAFVKR